MLLDVWSLADANNETRLEHFVMKWSAKTHHVSNPPEANHKRHGKQYKGFNLPT